MTPFHQGEVASPPIPDEIRWLEAIPVLDYEPEQEREDEDFGSCHLCRFEGCHIALCGDTVNAHIAIPVASYQPGSRCHDCGRRRCEKCVRNA